MGDSRIKDVGTLLSAFFDEEKLRRGGRYAQFFESWRAVVGDRLAAHSRVVDLEKGILIVEAEHPGWIQLLQLRQSQTLDALTRRFPDLSLRGIAFRLVGSGSRSLPMRSIGSAVEPSSNEESGPPDEEINDIEALPEASIPPSGQNDREFQAALSSLKKAIQTGKKK